MNDKQIDELINKVLREEQALPEGISERLEQRIDAWAIRRRHSLYYWWMGGAVAAVLLLCVGIFGVKDEGIGGEQPLVDTYTDPQEAAVAARKALAFISSNLNKGIDQVYDTRQEIDKVNRILNKQFKNKEDEN